MRGTTGADGCPGGTFACLHPRILLSQRLSSARSGPGQRLGFLLPAAPVLGGGLGSPARGWAHGHGRRGRRLLLSGPTLEPTLQPPLSLSFPTWVRCLPGLLLPCPAPASAQAADRGPATAQRASEAAGRATRDLSSPGGPLSLSPELPLGARAGVAEETGRERASLGWL